MMTFECENDYQVREFEQTKALFNARRESMP